MRFSIRWLIAAAAVVSLVGCASGPKRAALYHWGEIPDILHKDLTQELSPEQQLQRLEQQQALMEKAGHPVPPGLAMHMALLYQRLGQHERAQHYLDLEARRYPSLRGFVEWLQRRVGGGKVDDKA